MVVLVVVALGGVYLVRRNRTHYVLLRNGSYSSVEVPVVSTLSPLRTRIIKLAEDQLGYRTDPANSYCNKFSAYWYSGTTNCSGNNRDEQWCADFAAWVWQLAGVPVVYQYLRGDLNSSSASFYEWGVAHHTWHAAGSGYTPEPGDVAIYGLDRSTLVATHVAVVVGYIKGERGPIAVNGDGDETGFSVVEVRGGTSTTLTPTPPGRRSPATSRRTDPSSSDRRARRRRARHLERISD